MTQASIPLHNKHRTAPFGEANLFASRTGIVSLMLGSHDGMSTCMELTPACARRLADALHRMADEAGQVGGAA